MQISSSAYLGVETLVPRPGSLRGGTGRVSQASDSRAA